MLPWLRAHWKLDGALQTDLICPDCKAMNVDDPADVKKTDAP